MPTEPLNLAEIDARLSVVRDNLSELVEQAAAYSGAGDEDRMSSRIAEQEEQLELLTRQREALLGGRPDGA
jgi:enolase